MTLPGKFDVSSNGAAAYTVPIAAPPGTAGMVPSLSLNYDSHSGNGLVGVGWSLGGLPSIGRCARTVVQDGVHGGVNYDTNDRFCLDGQRLVAVSGVYGADGTEYRTEIESFSRVISHGTAGAGPAWFEVRTKSGQLMEFGNTTDARVLAQGKTTARSWALNKVSDTKGNYYTATYVNDTANGQVYPSRIDYTGNTATGLQPYNSVRFVYAARSDISPYYHAGSLMKTTVRLTNVQTYAGSALVVDYRLAYQQSVSSQNSQLISVAMCASDGSCLPASTFSWSSTGDNGTFTHAVNHHPANWDFWSPAPMSYYLPISGDFNGDGKSDFLYVGGTADYVFLSNGDGTFTTTMNAHPSGWNFWSPAPISEYRPIGGDFNGDGKADFLLISGTADFVFLSNGDGTFTHTVNHHPTYWDFWSPAPITYYLPIPGDFNGDGKTDFLIISGTAEYVFFSNGDGSFTIAMNAHPSGWNFWSPAPIGEYRPIVGDFNGDGKTDFLLISGTADFVFVSNGDGTFTHTVNHHPTYWDFWSPAPMTSYLPIPGDFNGDGQTDFLIVSGTAEYVFFSKGDGTFTTAMNAHPSGWNFWSPAPISEYRPITGDFNGDGKSDFLLLSGTADFVFLGNGDGTFTHTVNTHPTNWNFWSPAPITYYLPVSGDFNGDGKTDFMVGGGTAEYVFLKSGPLGDLLASAASGVGAQTAITYSPLTNANIYYKDSNAVYPQVDVKAPIYVVSRVDASNGIGGTYSTGYAYLGAKADVSGRGFLGFRQMKVTDLQTNLRNVTNFRQDFPYIGQVLLSAKVNVPSSQILSRTDYTYQFSNASGAASVSAASATSAPYRVSVAQAVTIGQDLDTTALPTVTTGYQYDAYGNATQVVVSTPDGFSKTTTSTFTNNTTNWFLGRLNASTVTSQTP